MESRTKIPRFKLRNEIMLLYEKRWGEVLGCTLIPGHAVFHQRERHLKYYQFQNLIIGFKKGGKAIFIYPHPTRAKLSRKVADFLRKAYDVGCLVGCANDAFDAYDIIADDEKEYKRKKRTYLFLDDKEVDDGTDEDDEDDKIRRSEAETTWPLAPGKTAGETGPTD